MKWFECVEIEGRKAVRKYHKWGTSLVFNEKFEDCFTLDELVEAIRILTVMDDKDPRIGKCKIKIKEKIK